MRNAPATYDEASRDAALGGGGGREGDLLLQKTKRRSRSGEEGRAQDVSQDSYVSPVLTFFLAQQQVLEIVFSIRERS